MAYQTDCEQSKKEIFEFLSIDGSIDDEFSSENIMLLLGAGASMDAGVGTLKEILNTVTAEIDERVTSAELKYLKWVGKQKSEELKGQYSIELIAFNREKRKKALFNYLRNKCKSVNYSLNDSANVEEILALINDVVAMKQTNNLYNVIGEWDKELIEASKDDFELLKELKQTIERIIVRSLDLTVDDGDKKLDLQGRAFDKSVYSKLKYFNFIFYMHRKVKGELNIFTLNHDLTVEEAFRLYCQEELLGAKASKTDDPRTLLQLYKDYYVPKGEKADPNDLCFLPLPPETGFNNKIYIDTVQNRLLYKYESNKGNVFNPDNLLRTNELENKALNASRIKLYKLHGSIDWHRNPNGKIYSYSSRHRQKSDESDITEMIFGVSQKYKSEEPYSTLYYEFKRKLREPKLKLLIAVGYAFNDTHINDAIVSALEANPGLKVVISDPSICETYFFSHPVLEHSGIRMKGKKKVANEVKTENATAEIQDAAYYQNILTQKIIPTRVYEEYMNMIDVLFSTFYSRNFDEDALFLAFANFQRLQTVRGFKEISEKDFYLKYTKASLKKGNNWLEKLFEDDIDRINGTPRDFLNTVATSFAKPTERNKLIYHRIFEKDEDKPRYLKIIESITSIKSIVFSNLNRIRSGRFLIDDGYEREADKIIPDLSQQRSAYERCFLELGEDLNMVETFIQKVIPVHVYLIFFYIEQYNRTLDEYEILFRQSGNDKDLKRQNELGRSVKFLSEVVLELFLKYHYMNDVIKIQLVKSIGEKEASHTNKLNDYGELLGVQYVNAFDTMLKKMKIVNAYTKKELEDKNANTKLVMKMPNSATKKGLRTIPHKDDEAESYKYESRTYTEVLEEINSFLDQVRDSIVNAGIFGGNNNDPFVNKFFCVNPHCYQKNNRRGDSTGKNVQRTLSENAREFFDGNFLARNVLHQKNKVENTMQRKIQLYSKARCKSLITRDVYRTRLLTDLEQLVSIADNNFLNELSNGNFDRSKLKMERDISDYFNSEQNGISFNIDEKEELRSRIAFNVNSYTRKQFKNQFDRLGSKFTLNFGKYYRNIEFLSKLHHRSNKLDSKVALQKWKNYQEECGELLKNNNQEKFDKTGKAVPGQLLYYFKENERVIFRHFKAKLFFSKEFRLLNFFKFYNSKFYATPHLHSFNNVEKVVRDFIA